MRHAESRVPKLVRTFVKPLAWIPLGMALAACPAPVADAGQPTARTEVEAAVLNEDWSHVVALLDAVTNDAGKSPTPCCD